MQYFLKNKTSSCTKTSLLLMFLLIGSFLTCTKNPLTSVNNFSCKISLIGKGSLSISPSDTLLPAGTVVTLSATPAKGYIFSGFLGTVTSTASPFRFALTKNTAISAIFIEHPTDTLLATIPAKNKTFLMGSVSKQTLSIETPPHPVSFTYDFFIDKYEISKNLYNTILDTSNKTSPQSVNPSDYVPITNISWYDAILFCNARSKKAGYDTVYTYSSLCQNTNQCPYVLENLSIHYERFGYRLPTEAEWEFACRATTTGDAYWSDSTKSPDTYAWYFENSSSAPNPVGLKTPNKYGLFDMCGNVAEWVADTLYAYSTTARINPVSFITQGYSSTGTMPIKGGSFRNGSSYLRSATRKGPYDTPAYSVMPDIGFRCVLGTFDPQLPKDQFIPIVDSSNILVTADNNAIASFIGTDHIKISFVTNVNSSRNLHFLDYSQSGRTISTLRDSSKVFSPTISPDGNYVAYSSKGEGFTGMSSVTIRPLTTNSIPTFKTGINEQAYIPKFWVSPQTQDTFIIYTSGASPNIEPSWSLEKTYKRKFSGGVLLSNTEILYDKGSYHGGVSKDGRFLGTSFPVAKLIDMQIGDTNIFYFLPPQNGQDTTNQESNASISPSSTVTDELMFLDNGYSKISTIVGRSYAPREIIYICNSKFWTTEHISHFFIRPEGFSEWATPHWSNHPDFAIAVCRKTGSDSTSLFIINIADSTYLHVASGIGIIDPYLYINPLKKPEFVNPYAQFGAYDLPIQTPSQVTYTQKLRLFWTRHNDLTGIIFGSSPTWFGINPHYLTSVDALNLSAFASYPGNSVKLALSYALPQMPKLKTIIIGFDPGWFTGGLSRPQINGIEDSKGYELDAANNFYRSGIPPSIESVIKSYNAKTWYDYDSAGFTKQTYLGNGWGEPTVDWKDFSLTDTSVRYTMKLFETLADSVKNRGINLLIVNFPENPKYATNTQSIGRYGPSISTYTKMVAWLKNLQINNPYLHFYDANNYGNHDYTDADALDANHLNSIGAVKLSKRIDSLLVEVNK